MTNKTIPAISVIIPMYNAEKYIGECLDSILAQTFDDYEVIVIDNCSTDNSAKIVESYIPKFKNKLEFFRLKDHYSCAGIPRNIGTEISCGEYIFYIDSDDVITSTAVEELAKIAKDFDADIVQCQRFYTFSSNEDIKKRLISNAFNVKIIEKPMEISDDLIERAKLIIQKSLPYAVWTKLIRKNFIAKNNLKMIDALGQDAVFTCCLACSNSKYIICPNIVNFYRIRSDSTWSSSRDDLLKVTERWIRSLDLGFKYLNEFLDRQEFFQKRSDVKYELLNAMIKEFGDYFIKFYAQIPAYKIYPFVFDQITKIKDPFALTSHLFSRMNVFNVQLIQQQMQIQQLQAQLQQSTKYLKEQQRIIHQLENLN